MTQPDDLKRLVRRAFDAAVAAGHPGEVTRAAMARLDSAPTAVIAVGKAAASMAQAVRDSGCDAPGILVTTDESFAEVDTLGGLVFAIAGFAETFLRRGKPPILAAMLGLLVAAYMAVSPNIFRNWSSQNRSVIPAR